MRDSLCTRWLLQKWHIHPKHKYYCTADHISGVELNRLTEVEVRISGKRHNVALEDQSVIGGRRQPRHFRHRH